MASNPTKAELIDSLHERLNKVKEGLSSLDFSASGTTDKNVHQLFDSVIDLTTCICLIERILIRTEQGRG